MGDTDTDTLSGKRARKIKRVTLQGLTILNQKRKMKRQKQHNGK